MTLEEKFEYLIMLLMCASVAFGLYWVTVEIHEWSKLPQETRYIDIGDTCTDKY